MAALQWRPWQTVVSLLASSGASGQHASLCALLRAQCRSVPLLTEVQSLSLSLKVLLIRFKACSLVDSTESKE